ncbi:protein, clustered with ribosomal protein L32p [Halomonas beimenensis]|uniref:Large ribosomal RNA subunit accumulation protein YceD n=2 Tax=Halomonas beimenensis TaxID=475662 RepID=A0A291P5T7_9GAMM|nr:protein, clustered with ribosomal protein L32p [Halomonas beimenensis]
MDSWSLAGIVTANQAGFDRGEGSAYHCAPMLTSRLPGRVEPYKLAAHAEHLEGLVALGDLPRLAEEIGAQQGEARVWLDFAIDAQGRRVIRGHLEAELQLPCRRCLSPLAELVESDFLLGMVTSDALAADLPSTHEPVLVENEQLNLLAVVEDELILSLPQVVYHDEAECAVSRDQLTSGAGADSSDSPSESPFDVLKRLKGKT